MDFLKKISQAKQDKKTIEAKEKVLEILTKGNFDEMNSFVPKLKKENEAVILGIEEGINEALETEPALHENLKQLFLYLFESDSPTLFTLFYDSLLFNVPLYRFLITAFDAESEAHFDFLILTKVEDYEDTEVKGYIFGVLAFLKDSFLARVEMDKKLGK